MKFLYLFPLKVFVLIPCKVEFFKDDWLVLTYPVIPCWYGLSVTMEVTLRFSPSMASLSALLVAPAFCWFKLVQNTVPEPYLVRTQSDRDRFMGLRMAGWVLSCSTGAGISPRPLGNLGSQNHYPSRLVRCLDLTPFWWFSIFRCWFLDVVRYLLSYFQFTLLKTLGWSLPLHETSQLRLINLFAGVILLEWVVYKILLLGNGIYDGKTNPVTSAAIQESKWPLIEIRHAVVNICFFPPLFFFYGLYYTDVISVFFVLYTYRLHLERKRMRLVSVGLASLSLRQTNIFWVSVFLGGLEIIRNLPKGRSGVVFPEKSSFFDIVVGSWQHACVYDPLISQACFEGCSPTLRVS